MKISLAKFDLLNEETRIRLKKQTPINYITGKLDYIVFQN